MKSEFCLTVFLLLLRLPGIQCTLTRTPTDTLFLSGAPFYLNCSTSLSSLSWTTSGETIYNGSSVFDARFTISTSSPFDLQSSNASKSLCGKYFCADASGSSSADVSIIDKPICVVNTTTAAENDAVLFTCSASYCGIVQPLINIVMGGTILSVSTSNTSSFTELSRNIINPVTCSFNNQFVITCPQVVGGATTVPTNTLSGQTGYSVSSPKSSSSSGGLGGMSSVAIIGAVVGSVVGLAVALGVVVVIAYRYGRQSAVSTIKSTMRASQPAPVRAAPRTKVEPDGFAFPGLDRVGPLSAAATRPCNAGYPDHPLHFEYVYNPAAASTVRTPYYMVCR